MDRRLLIPLVALAVGISSCGGGDEQNDEGPDWSGETIRIGSLFSTTGIGEAVGPQQVNGAQLAVDEINEGGGVNGAEIVLEQVDDRSDPEQSKKAMRELIMQDRVLAVLGPTFTNSSVVADPVAERLTTVVLGVSNTGQGYSGKCGRCDFVWRVSLPEFHAIPANVREYREASDARRVTVIHPLDDPFAESTAKLAVRALEEEGFEVTGPEVFAPEEAGPQPGIEAALDAKADAMFVTTSSGEGAADVIEIARDVGFEGDILGGNAFNIATAAEQAGAAGEGAQSAAAWSAGDDSEANRSFIEAYRNRYGEEPDQFAAQAYMGLKVLAEDVRLAEIGFEDLRADRIRMRDVLMDVNFDDSPLGPLSLDALHDPVQTIWVVQMDGEGGYRPVSERPPTPSGTAP